MTTITVNHILDASKEIRSRDKVIRKLVMKTLDTRITKETLQLNLQK